MGYRFAVAGLTIAALGLFGCGETPQSQGSACATDLRAQTYVDGLSLATDTGGFTVTLVRANPGPPDRGDNNWTLSVTDSSGVLSGKPVKVRPWMPDHGHGTTPLSNDATDVAGDPGTYTVGPFDLFMPGFWEFGVSVESGGATGTAMFAFCLEG